MLVIRRHDDFVPTPISEALMKSKLAVTVFLLILVIVFLIQNAAIVEIRFLFWNLAVPRSLLIVMLLLIGMIVGWFARAMYRVSRHR